LAQFQQEQQALFQQWQTLVSQGATQQQLAAWQQQNAAQFQAQQQLAQALSAASALQPMPLISQVNIPANAPPTLSDFLTTQASLANARAQIHNQLLQAMPAGATQQQINQMHQQEIQTFQQQHGNDLQLQAQCAQSLSAQSASKLIPDPGPAVIPPNATPQLQALLNAQRALARDWARVRNQYATANPSVRAAAMEQWQQQNAVRFAQLRALAQNLSNSTANQ